jgi:DNA-binding XRE family transcriptional regulator
LQKDQVISGWQYDRWNEEATSRRGWIEEWVQATLLIEPPEMIKEAYQPIALLSPAESDTSEVGQKLPLITPETLELVAQLKQRRKALKLSQLQMAERLNIAQSYFSKLENGHLNPSPAIYKRLKEWLETTASI